MGVFFYVITPDMQYFKGRLPPTFSVPLKFFLGIEFLQEKRLVQMSQSKYCKSILERFDMLNSHPVKTPCEPHIHDLLRENSQSPVMRNPKKYRELVGSLIYLEQVSRPDISFVTNILGQQMANPTLFHWRMGLRVLQYLKGTINFTLNYRKAIPAQLTCFADADWGNAQDRKSQSGYMCYLHRDSSPVSWSSRKQNLVATSTCNSEYIALSEAACEVIWLQKLLKFINLPHLTYQPAQMYSDNTGAIALCYNPCHHRRSKHIEIKHEHVRDHVLKGTFDLTHVPSKDNAADGFTKPLAATLFAKFKAHCAKIKLP